MKKKAKKATSKKPKKAIKKPKAIAAKKKPAAKAKKAKPAKKIVPAKKRVVKKPQSKPIAKKTVKALSKPVAKKDTKPVIKPVVKPDPKPVIEKNKVTATVVKPAIGKAKPVVHKLTPAEIQKLGLKPLPKALPTQVKDEKKPKGYYTLEYMINSSPDILFEFVSTASGLEKWFAEKVNVKENHFHFEWDKDETRDAELIALKEGEFARFRWNDQADNKKFFEFRIQIDDLTSEVALIVSDFADTPQEHEDARLLWNAQIHDLLHALGGAP